MQAVVEELNEGNDAAAFGFAKHILAMHVPCTTTPLCSLYTEENAAIRYAQQFLKNNMELGIENAIEALALHAARFDYADTPMLTPESAVSVLDRVCEVFPYAEKVINENPIEILLIEAQPKPATENLLQYSHQTECRELSAFISCKTTVPQQRNTSFCTN